jgi:hypothetical protein
METTEILERNRFKELSTSELKKIYFRSESIKSIAAIIVVAIVGWGFKADLFVRYGGENIVLKTLTHPLNITVLLLSILAFIGLIRRTFWGRIVGIVTCILWVGCAVWFSRFSIFILFGIWGLFVLIPRGNLFGPHRIDAKEIKSEYKWRKKNMIA